MEGQRLISPRDALAREFGEADLSPIFRSNGTAMPDTAEYARHLAEQFRRLAADGRRAGRATAVDPDRGRCARCRTGPRSPATIASRAGARSANGTACSCRAVLDHAGLSRGATISSSTAPTASATGLILRASTWSTPSTRRPSRLGHERPSASDPQRRAFAPARRAPARLQAGQIYPSDRGRREPHRSAAARAVIGKITDYEWYAGI